MAMLKKLGFFGAPLLVMAAGALATAACDKAAPGLGADELCGPCGEIAKGDVGISGNVRLDGFFAAVATLDKAVITVNADFIAGLENLEAAFGITAKADIDARVDDIIAAIKAEVSANASAGLQVDVQPAQCSANVDIAVKAQADCEVQAECDVKADPGKVSVECSGSCEGSCDGNVTCEGEAYCEVEGPQVECEGTCEGSCTLEASAKCEGTCHGECSGECSAYAKDGEGNAECAGKCDGECKGSCELAVAAECQGKCEGTCNVKKPSAECDAKVSCEGSAKCDGKCEGKCEGEVTPPSASADCDASAECNAQASAQASASVECTPPSIQIGFAFTGDADAKASFEAKMGALRLNAPVMLTAAAKYQALITGKIDGKTVFEVPPVEAVINGLGEINLDGDFVQSLPVGRIPCVLAAVPAAVSTLGDIVSDSATSVQAQAKFYTAFAGGFKAGS